MCRMPHLFFQAGFAGSQCTWYMVSTMVSKRARNGSVQVQGTLTSSTPPQFHFIFVCELAIFSNVYHITMIFVDENFFSRLCTSRNMGDGCHEGKGTKKSPMLSLRKAGLCFFQGFTYSISQPCQKTMDHDQKNAGPKQTKILQDPVVQDGLILEDRLNEAKWLGFFRL